MSKTRKTRPLWVKLNESGHARLTEQHDHSEGACDLPRQPVWLYGPGAPNTRCFWGESTEAAFDRSMQCGCKMCTDQVRRKQLARNRRHQGRSYASNGWRAEYDA